jgi:mersacidin/lichenicidin family type 2 lantibiotic
MNIVHVRKGTAHRQNVSTEKQAPLHANPACEIELTDADLDTIYGGQLGEIVEGVGDVLNGTTGLVTGVLGGVTGSLGGLTSGLSS